VKLTDYAVMALVASMWVASIVFLFNHPSETNFGIWAGLCVTMVNAYQFLLIYDDKQEDRK